mgnify:CR=1 FL=1
MSDILLIRPFRLISILIVVFLTNCSLVKNNQTQDSNNKTDFEDFDVFYDKFHRDSIFQMSRIKFPLKGIMVDGWVQEKWKKKNWSTLKTKVYDIDTTMYMTDYIKTDKSFVEKVWIKDSGFFMEYRFNLIRRKWYLVYAVDQNL